jgi:tetratricopeptide (TPR) repeat protein
MFGLSRFFNKTTCVIFLILVTFVLWVNKDWTRRQYDKVLSTYYVYRGDRAYRKNNLQNAIDYYNLALELYPAHYEARFNLGNIYVVYEDYNAAVDCYRKALDYNSNFNVARMNYGIVSAEKLGNFDGAIEQYQKIIENRQRTLSIPFIFSNKKSIKFNKGTAYYNMGVAYRSKAIYEHSQDSTMRSEDLQNAVAAYIKASKLLKKDYNTFYNLGIAYHLLGNYQQAGESYCKAISVKPMNYEAHYNLAILLKHLKMYKQALGELEKANILISNETSNTSSYVFDVLNDVSQTMVNSNQYKDLVDRVGEENSSVTKSLTYVHGKIVATDALDKAMLKNFSTCETKNFFEKY